MYPCFHKNLGPHKLGDLFTFLNCKAPVKYISMSENINNFSDIIKCSHNDIVFVNDNTLVTKEIPAKTILLSNKNNSNTIVGKAFLRVDNLHLSVAKLSNLFYKNLSSSEIKRLNKPKFLKPINKIPEKSIIDNGCVIGSNFIIGQGSVINHTCIIGNNVKIGSNTVIKNAIIGNNVKIGSNSSIGQSGFGFAFNKDNNVNIFHTGRVVIQDNSQIGCNCTIDRGSFSDTIIGENTYLDNLVHVAHNVTIGSNTAIAGQTGIAGSTNIGNYVKIGGQVGISGHIDIGDFVEIAAKSGVRKSITDKQKVMGDPAINMFTYLKKYKKNFLAND